LGYPVRNVPPGQTIDISYTVSWVGMTSEGCKSSSPCILTVSLNAPPNGWAWNLGAFTTISVTTDQGSVTKKITVTTPNTIGAKADLVVYVTCTRGCSSASLTNGFGQGLTLTVVMASTCSSTNCSTGVPEFPATLGGLLIATAILVPALILLKREHFNQSK